MRRGSPGRARGVMLLLMLLAVAAVSAGAMAVASNWTRDIQRDKEAQLLRIGDQYARAIASYYYATPGPVKQFPQDLAALLEDRRGAALRRHLRHAYADPLTGGAWATERGADGGIIGVYSSSERATWRRAPVTLEHCTLPAAQQVSQWKFLARVS